MKKKKLYSSDDLLLTYLEYNNMININLSDYYYEDEEYFLDLYDNF